jgi:hypothetical protein
MWLKWAVFLIVGFILLFTTVLIYGRIHWNRITQNLLQQLETNHQSRQVAVYSEAKELNGLPAPVQRYFKAALRDANPIITAVNISHSGTFNMSADAEQWRPFVSTQRVVTHRPGFVWDGRIEMFPGVSVHVHDAYVAGEGILHPSIMGMFSLTELRGSDELAKGELMRFLAEAAWYPTALLPSQGVTWQAIDDHSARAHIRDGSTELQLTFRFREDGLIDSIRAEDRGRTVGKQVIATPWEGRWFDYQWQNGMQVPGQGEVAWILPEGAKPYWRGKLTHISYDSAK